MDKELEQLMTILHEQWVEIVNEKIPELKDSVHKTYKYCRCKNI